MNNFCIRLGISPCPNDTFAFYHLLHEKDLLPFKLDIHIEDVETLNNMMLKGSLDITKASFHALGYALDRYLLLRAGSALGRGCGPLLLARKRSSFEQPESLKIAVPGKFTTAAMLLKLYAPEISNMVPMNFAEIPEAIKNGHVDAGLVIHELRFTYMKSGLECVQDLGEWWEQKTGLPIPLGGIAAKRTLPSEWLNLFNRCLTESIDKAWANPHAPLSFMQCHAADMSQDVMKKHVKLYVNQFTRDIGKDGENAVIQLMKKGAECGLFDKPNNIQHITLPE